MSNAEPECAAKTDADLFERVFSNAHILIAYMDTAFNFIRVNSAYAAADGKTPGDFVGKNHFDLYPNADNEQIFRRVVVEGQPYYCYAKPFTYVGHPERGVSFWDWSLQPVKDAAGHMTGVVLSLLDVTERVRATAALQRSEALFRAITEQSGEGVALIDRCGRSIVINRRLTDIAGAPSNQGISPLLTPCFGPDSLAWAFDVNRTLVRECELPRPDGAAVPVEMALHPIQVEAEPYLLLILRDVSVRQRVEADRRKLSSALEQTADAVMVTDCDGRIEYVNPAFSEMTGYGRDEVLGRSPSFLKSGKHDAASFRQLWDTIQKGGVFRDILINRKKNGALYYEEKTISPLKDDTGRITHYIATGKDITARMQAEERLYYLANHDIVTGLPNRLLFMERFNHALARASRGKRALAVLFLDLDRFKKVNDNLGHDAGDRVLQAVARRLREAMRDDDTVARFAGDEFTVLLEETAGLNEASVVAEKLLAALAQPFHVDEHEVFISASIGISVYPHDGDDAKTLLHNADAAMYQAKDRGRNRSRFYSSDLNTTQLQKLVMETGLRYALERNELILHYQPLVDLRSGRVAGVEALLRWQHPDYGLVPPADFIPLLEDNGLIVPVGEWVLYTACEQAKTWLDQGLGPIRMSVNLSARQFHEPNLTEQVAAILERTGLPPHMLELEITESVIMRNAQATIDTLNALSTMGVRLAVDDFGTGYSSLSYLKRFPINTLKIDQSFVSDIATSADDAAIVRAIVAMAHNLKLDVVAEGVETLVQRRFLDNCACDTVQGFLFSSPLTDQDATRLLKRAAAEA